jgi:hypothetical protein
VFSRKTWCQNARKDYAIESYASFGSATLAAKTIWKDYKCNQLLESKLSMLNPIADCSNTHSDSETNSTSTTDSYPLIAILVGVTTRKLTEPSLRDLDIFTVSMPSLMSSLDCGYRYHVLLGYDVGDPFYDSDKVSC